MGVVSHWEVLRVPESGDLGGCKKIKFWAHRRKIGEKTLHPEDSKNSNKNPTQGFLF